MSLAHGDDDFDFMDETELPSVRKPRMRKQSSAQRRPKPRRTASAVDLAENGLLGSEFEFPEALRRRLSVGVGVLLLAIVASVVAALSTWSVEDPSFSHATDNTAQNILGFPGAVISDLVMQLIGFGSIALLCLMALWGWRLLSGQANRIAKTRIGAWLIGTVAVCGVLAVLPVAGGWPLPIGMGGYIGDLARQPFAAFFGGGYDWLGRVLAGFLYAGLGYWFFRYAAEAEVAGVDLDEPLDPNDMPDDETAADDQAGFLSNAFGLLTHWGLMAQVQLRRLVGLPSFKTGRPGQSFVTKLTRSLRDDDDDGLNAFLTPRERELQERERLARATEEADGGRRISVERLREGSVPIGYGAEEPEHDQYDDQDDTYDDPADWPHEPHFDPRFDGEAHHTSAKDRRFETDGAYDDDPYDDDTPHSDTWAGFDHAIQSVAATEIARTLDDTELARGIPADGLAPPPPPRWRNDAPSDDDLRAISVAKPAPAQKPGKRIVREAQPSLLEPEEYQFPPLALLSEPKPQHANMSLSDEALTENARLLEGVLDDFGVRGEIINVRPGPVVTLYELEPAPGIKSSRVIGLADDIARSMSAISARVAVIPGKNAIGIELPNSIRETVFLRELVASETFEKSKAKLPLCLGKGIGGEAIIADLARMPHLLVAGTTGSGKSVSINTMILSALYHLPPDKCKLIMIDPKMLELSVYDGIPHLLTPVVTDPKKAVVALKWTVREMEDRYKKMSKLGVRNIDGFNTRVAQAQKKGEVISRTIQTGFDKETGEAIFEEEQLDLSPMSYIIVVVDEMADLMMVAGKDIEGAIQRLAQMARAAGIHLIMATQRPSVDVITGTIKANFPTRISFQVTSKIDSRTILGEQGAEQLLGQGDMLYMAGGGRIQRVHGPFVSDDEVESIVAHLKAQGLPQYLDGITDEDEDGAAEYESSSNSGGDGANELYDKAVNIVLRDKKASTSYIQRRLSIGYNRAASLIERMEDEGVVGPANHAGKREILVGDGVD